MKPYGLNELREMFLRFFETKGHLRLPSFSLIPQDDASLLLINSGMAPMKPYFKGDKEPPRHRVCTCQKCIRTGDIENIGKTARHGTYFEMLGNFSFGDYFKHEAIAWSWEFLTSPDWVGLDPERLYPSVYEKDDEAFAIWRDEIGIPESRITRLGKDDNFWEHGSGPCGPCSEIYFDRGEEYGCGKPDCAPGCDCDRYMEVWNNVFSQFDNDGNGNYSDLIQKNIDTGMGLERLAVVCQGVDSLFDVDTVMNITHKVSEITGAHYGDSHKTDVSLRVITDHIRASVMMISDGILPSNEGRGYVLRRLLRRAARHGKLLGVNEPFLYQVVDMVVHENECQYPELREKQAYITRVIRNEEENFAKTIDAGMHIFSDLLAEHQAKGERVFSGADAFKLYDTYGFPIDLTREMVQEQDMTVDEDAFQDLMEQQRVRARKAREALGDLAWAGVDLGLDPTPTQFTGYDHTVDQGTILAIVCDGEVCSEIDEGKQGVLVLDCTPFYAEMGGQVADHGVIETDGALFQVTDVQKDKAGKFLHHGVMHSGHLQVEQTVTARIDTDRRKAIMRAHSATHLLQAALREVLGDHVHQAGSLVEPDHLRFDLTHFSAITPEELEQVNEIVGDWILDGMDVTVSEMSMEQAKASGATALFSEKYGDVVRVVNMGGKSIELCGGTHVDNTAKIGPFRITGESSVASGVRRVEAITGKAYLREMEAVNRRMYAAAEVLHAKPADLIAKAKGFTAELKEARQSVERMKEKILHSDVDRFLYASKNIGGIKVITTTRTDLDAGDLRKLGDFLRDKDPDTVAVLATATESKVTFVAVCGKNAVAKGIRAGDLVRAVSAVTGGKGGGKPDSAMGGGSEVLKIDDALAIVDDFVADKLGL
ncbi:MAG: alanine--tRNA ligase [Clostridiales bacterium]|nr:alanine--tRNA ligase [Clostridiales bacterium]MCI7812001.1 alanine--tRNA ligase [Clostridiales bacterium]